MNKRHYEHTLPNIRGSLSNTYISRRRPGSSQRHGAASPPSTRPFPALMRMTGRISSRRRVSRMYASGLYTTESCSDIWRNAALAAMWLYRTVGKSDIPCTGNGISPSDSGMSATDTSCATGFSRPACHLRTFH